MGVDRVVKSVEKKKSYGRHSVCSAVEVRTVLLDWKTKQGRLRGRDVLGNSCSCKRTKEMKVSRYNYDDHNNQ